MIAPSSTNLLFIQVGETSEEMMASIKINTGYLLVKLVETFVLVVGGT